ncbi:hypothetical protein HYH03_002879 [Edaphochlamys debaryana]|uniref:Uncharacterized protein n=1 Tax=Edaphochlamys debaryana TaxID=47281 RepID=A0A836C3N7_9CHLO|nr:hypothetical protein HYH03_002879 [Edaphochlamys debaryana]|eukprot:KAG2499301.1 hypothetical protein HYH03_002879 [Edaphochlamys debaryana]
MRTHYCGPGRVRAEVHMGKEAGPHLIQVSLQSRSFSFCDLQSSCGVVPKPDHKQPFPWLGYLVIHSLGGPLRVQWSLDPKPFTDLLKAVTPKKHPAPKAAGPPCPATGLAPGYWAFTRWPAPEVAELAALCYYRPTDERNKMRTCDRTEAPGRLFNTPHWRTSMRWVPHGCQPPEHHHLVERRPCLDKWLADGKRMCTVGDSHMRYLARALQLWSDSKAGDELKPYGSEALDKVKMVELEMENVHYIKDVFGESSIKDIPGRFNECSVVYASFGAWQLTESNLANIQNFMPVMEAFADAMAAVAQTGVRVVWVTAPSTLLRDNSLRPGCHDLRMPRTFEAYNQIAHGLFTKLQLPVLDWWLPTVSLLEAAFDSAHFLWNGTPGSLLVDKVVQDLCTEAVR